LVLLDFLYCSNANFAAVTIVAPNINIRRLTGARFGVDGTGRGSGATTSRRSASRRSSCTHVRSSVILFW